MPSPAVADGSAGPIDRFAEPDARFVEPDDAFAEQVDVFRAQVRRFAEQVDGFPGQGDLFAEGEDRHICAGSESHPMAATSDAPARPLGACCAQ